MVVVAWESRETGAVMDESEKPISPEELTAVLNRVRRAQRWHLILLFLLVPVVLVQIVQFVLDMLLGS